MTIEAETTFAPPGMLDTLRDAERAAWADFEATPTPELRREHFLCLMTLLREIDARAAALLELPRPESREP